MKKRLAVSMVLLLGVGLGGCVGINSNTSAINVPVSTPQADGTEQIVNVPVELDRYGAHAFTVSQQEATKRKALDVEKAEFEAEKASFDAEKVESETTVLTIDTPGKLKDYVILKAINGMAAANKMLGRVAITQAKSNGGGRRDIKFATAEMPKGAFAEGVDSVGGAVTKIVQTPAGLATSVGLTIGSAIRESKKGDDDQGIQISTEDGNVSLADVNNNKSVSTPGTGSFVQQEMGTSKDVENAGEGSATGADGVDAQQPSTTTTETHDTDTSSNIL